MISFARRQPVVDPGEMVVQGCARHISEPGSGRCDRCNADFCRECLVFPRGPRKPPLCIPCAMNRAGVPVPSSHQALQRLR